MKKLLLILIFLIIIPVISADLVNITKTDFIKEPIQAYRLYKSDGISFDLKDKEYVLAVDEIGKDSIRIKSFIYKENGERELIYSFLNNKFSNKFDFDKDNYYDLKVSLGKLENKTVVLIFEKINEAKDNKISSEDTKKINFNFKYGILITAIIVIIILLIYLFLRKK